ncbi:MAG TPA: outer membrane lipoprotein carrier protein LolA [Gallionella sp.]|nr:outer membrane lipoprotein carrier protein LolA [Gallionella sp.]
MMPRALLGLLALVFMNIAFAADVSADPSTGLIALVQARLDQPELLRGRFVQQKSVKGFKKPLISGGDFTIWRGHGLLWHTQKPFESMLELRRDRLSVTQANGRSGYKLDGEREPGLRAVNELVFALFSGDIAMLKKYFHMQGELSGKQDWTLVLTPLDAGLMRAFKRVELSGDRYVRRVRLDEASGDSSVISFDQITAASAASPEEAKRLGN